MAQTERLYWIDAEIRAGRYPNARSVAERFEVSLRTAYADRDYLRERLHAPLTYDRRRGGWTYSDTIYSLPFLALAEPEAAALRRSLLAAHEYLGPQDSEPLDLLLHWLGEWAPLPSAEHEHVRGAVHLLPGLSHERARACTQAVRRRQKMRLLYFSANRGEVNERVVQPYDLVYWRGEPHLVAWCELREDVRQFFLGRVREWSLLEGEAAFARDPEFDIDAYPLLRGELWRLFCRRTVWNAQRE